MPFNRFLIAPYSSGLINNLKPWLTPDDSFQQLNNAVVFRGRIEKRWGTSYIEGGDNDLLSRLRIELGDTDGAGDFPATVVPGDQWFIGQQFSVGDAVFTVWQAAGAMLSTTAATGTFDTATGTVTITGATPATPLYYYPLMPVMGLTQYDTSDINFEPTIAFDQQFSYIYDVASSSFQRLGPNSIWTGSVTNFVWNRMFANTNPDEDWLFAVNNKPFPTGLFNVTTSPDGIKYRNNFTIALDWVNFCPLLRSAGTALRMTGAKCCVEFKGRLLFFAPWEAEDSTYLPPPAPPQPITLLASTQVKNRMRYSWLQTLTDTENSFFEASGKGGYIDAPTTQAIITVQFVKDRLIVYFESSTFELVYTGAPDQPFVWQKLDNTLGAESTFSEVPFDEVVVGIGANGVHACNGSSVVRIDEKIPDTVFSAVNEYGNQIEALSSINGIRDYVREHVYWTFPTLHENGNFPNKIMVYDYRYKNWAFFDDSYTFFGYHDRITGLIWATIPARTWSVWTDPWNTVDNLAHNRGIIAGNQQGFVFLITNDAELEPGLTITDLLVNTITCINHNVVVGDFLRVSGCVGSTNLNDITIQVVFVANVDQFTFITQDGLSADAGYVGGGLLQRIPNVKLTTKQFNFFTNNGQQTFIPYIEFLVDRTGQLVDGVPLFGGKHTIDYQVGSSNLSMVEASQGSGAILGTNVLETSPYPLNAMEATQDRLWHRVYFQALNDFIQIQVYWSEDQMYDPVIPFTGFALHAMLIYANAEGSQISS